ncbi:MAG: hypothetical protein ABI687_10810 [Flavitalea sp.]
MNNSTLFPILLFCSLFSALYVTGQADSTRLDLGRGLVVKNNMQHIIIRGEDLQRMPFSSLGEAIQVYLNGAYTNDKDIVYVIDGNLSNDINNYSVYDIENITLVQDAQRLLNGVNKAKQLVLIRTKTGYTRKSGITTAASVYLVKRREAGAGTWYPEKSPTLFHQYQVNARKYFHNTEIGGSMNFLREAFPSPSAAKIISADPYRLNRISFNSWMIASIGKKSVLNFRFNASPMDSSRSQLFQARAGYVTDNKGKEKYFNLYPSAQLSTRFSDALSNDLNVSYIHTSVKENNSILSTGDGPPPFTNAAFEKNYSRQSHLLFRDNISYQKSLRGFVVNPALGILIREGKNVYSFEKTSYYSSPNSPPNPGSISGSSEWLNMKVKERFLTPSLTITYNNILSLSGGLQFNLAKEDLFHPVINKTAPFVSAMSDILKIIKPTSSASLKLYASYAASQSITTVIYFPSVSYYIDGNGNIDTIYYRASLHLALLLPSARGSLIFLSPMKIIVITSPLQFQPSPIQDIQIPI